MLSSNPRKISTILTEVSHCFPQLLQETVGTVPRLGHDHFSSIILPSTQKITLLLGVTESGLHMPESGGGTEVKVGALATKAMTMKSTISWDVSPCSLVYG
jgi:hypothetical protein